MADNWREYQSSLDLIDQKIGALVNELATYQSRLRVVKTYEEVVMATDLKKEVSDEVDRHSKVCSNLSELSLYLIRMRTLRKSLGGANVVPAIVEQMRSRIDRMIQDLEHARSAYSYLKDAWEARLRFYNSCVYHL